MENKQYYMVMDIRLKRQMPGRELGELDTRRKIKAIIYTYLEKHRIPCDLLVVQPEQINLKVAMEDLTNLLYELKKKIFVICKRENVLSNKANSYDDE